MLEIIVRYEEIYRYDNFCSVCHLYLFLKIFEISYKMASRDISSEGTFLFRLQRFRMILSFLRKNEEGGKEKEKMEGTGRIK